LPNELNLRRGQGVGLVDEVAGRALLGQGFGGEGAGGGDGAGVFVPQYLKAGGGQRQFLAPDALYFVQPSSAHAARCAQCEQDNLISPFSVPQTRVSSPERAVAAAGGNSETFPQKSMSPRHRAA